MVIITLQKSINRLKTEEKYLKSGQIKCNVYTSNDVPSIGEYLDL